MPMAALSCSGLGIITLLTSGRVLSPSIVLLLIATAQLPIITRTPERMGEERAYTDRTVAPERRRTTTRRPGPMHEELQYMDHTVVLRQWQPTILIPEPMAELSLPTDRTAALRMPGDTIPA